jgi:hypothetical protein
VRFPPFRHLLIPVLAFAALAAWPKAAEAQPHRGPVHSRVVFHGGVYGPVFVAPPYRYGFSFGVGYGYGYPYYGAGYYGPFGYPYGPYGYYGPYPYPYYGRYDELNSSVRLEVNPKNAEVFVDGYRAGTVDDYDGVFQRLRVRPGQHEVTLYLDGYRSVNQPMHLTTGGDQKIRLTMVPLQPGEAQEARPEPAPAPPAEERADKDEQAPRPQAAPAGAFGSVSIRVQPADAQIFIDGEPWTGPASQDRLVVQLARGRHHVEVRKDGYDTYSYEIDVRAGATATLNISLPRRQ